MTLALASEEVCRVCGTSSVHTGLLSTNTSGGTGDLDTRPPEMMRSTMHLWVQQCPKCGLCAARITRPPAGAADTVRSPAYRALLDENVRMPQLARRFRAQSFVDERAEDLESAAYAALCAAWACDDASESEGAIDCRHRAIALYLRVADDKRHAPTELSKRNSLNLVLTDLLRRTGRFREARARCRRVLRAADETQRAIAQYELTLLDAGDTAVHRVNEAKAADVGPRGLLRRWFLGLLARIRRKGSARRPP